MPETQWMTLAETADMMMKLPDQVTQMCEDGKLEYYLEDGRYFVSRESIDLFMHPPTDEAAPANPDTNWTPRRQYGRAPDDIEPSPESVSDSETENGQDGVDAGDDSASEDSMEVSPGSGDEVMETAEDAQPGDVLSVTDHVEAAEDAQPVDELSVTDHVEAAEDWRKPVDELSVTDHVEAAEDAQPGDVLSVTDLVEAAEDLAEAADHEETVVDLAEAAEGQVEPAEVAQPPEDRGEPDARAAELLAELRAALARHAREHRAFCDEVAGLADALESTLSRDDEKTSELTREISSLLARYTRR